MTPAETHALCKLKKVCVLIPTYNNEQTVARVVRDVLTYTDQVIVVNDGATDSTPALLQQFDNIDLVSYPVNKGKGYALRTGFAHAVARGFDYAITIDSDGQHFAEDIPTFLAALNDHPNAVIIGARNMNQENVPGKSSFGNKFSNFWFKVETGITMQDTQSGYRLYPIRALKHIRFVTRKFEFEIEVLVRAAWRGIDMIQVPVKVYYAERGKRITHFRPFKDFTRISILNTALVTVALLYIKPRDLVRGIKKKNFRQLVSEQLFSPHESDAVKAFSIGFGVFMGIVPLWGFQLALAIGLAFLLRLNKALVVIAANISIPPMIPFILFLSHLTGRMWMGSNAQYISFNDEITLELMQKNFVQYVLGAVTLSVAAGVIFAGIAFAVLKLVKRYR